MKRVQFNVNNYVYVKLTRLGLQFLVQEHEAFWASHGRPNQKYMPPHPREDGYYGFQMWDFMEKFGQLWTLDIDPARYFETGATLEFDAANFEQKEPEPSA